MKPLPQLTYREVAKFVEEEVTASEAQEMARTLSGSPLSRKRLADVRKVVDAAGDTSEADGIDLLPAIRQKLADEKALGESPTGFRVRPRYVGLAVAAVLAMLLPAIVFFEGGLFTKDDRQEFRAKSATHRSDARARWISLNVFHLSGNEEPAPLSGTLGKDDGLLFTYTNLGPTPFSHLMVFAVDEQKKVYWYYPAFLDENSNPNAIPIQAGVSRAGLHEVISHPYAKGELTIFGLFSDNVLSVLDIENGVKNGIEESAGFETRFDGARVKALKVTVRK